MRLKSSKLKMYRTPSVRGLSGIAGDEQIGIEKSPGQKIVTVVGEI